LSCDKSAERIRLNYVTKSIRTRIRKKSVKKRNPWRKNGLKSRPIVSNRLLFWKHKNMARSIRWSVWRRFLSEENWWNLYDCKLCNRINTDTDTKKSVKKKIHDFLTKKDFESGAFLRVGRVRAKTWHEVFVEVCDDDFFLRKTDEICMTVSDLLITSQWPCFCVFKTIESVGNHRSWFQSNFYVHRWREGKQPKSHYVMLHPYQLDALHNTNSRVIKRWTYNDCLRFINNQPMGCNCFTYFKNRILVPFFWSTFHQQRYPEFQRWLLKEVFIFIETIF
jgi:hypothetical protein